MIEAAPSLASSVRRDPLETGANDRTVTTWDASFVMAGVRTIGPKRALRNTLQQSGRRPFRGPAASFTPRRKIRGRGETGKRIASSDLGPREPLDPRRLHDSPHAVHDRVRAFLV